MFSALNSDRSNTLGNRRKSGKTNGDGAGRNTEVAKNLRALENLEV